MLRREPRSGAGDHQRKRGTGGHSECEGTTNGSGEGRHSAPQRGRSGHDGCGATQYSNSGAAVQSRCRYRVTAGSSITHRGRPGTQSGLRVHPAWSGVRRGGSAQQWRGAGACATQRGHAKASTGATGCAWQGARGCAMPGGAERRAAGARQRGKLP
ncbi:hypothetical protein K438DRAFT_1798446, partial [Mycena galopus ATCC 62051]